MTASENKKACRGERAPAPRRIVLPVLLVGIGVHAFAIAAVPLFMMPDSVWYVQIAADIADRFDFSSELLLKRPVGYPAFLAAVFASMGPRSAFGVQLAQHVMVVITGYLAMRIAFEVTQSRFVTALTGLGTVCSLQLIGYANAVMAEVLYTLAALLALWCLVLFHTRGRWRLLAVASLIAGMATLIRPAGPALIGTCLLAALYRCWLDRPHTRRRVAALARATSLALLPALAVLALNVLLNGLAQGQFRLHTMTGAYLYYCARETNRLQSTTNEALLRIEAAMDEYEARQPSASTPLDRYSCIRAIEACREVYGITLTQADDLLFAAAAGLLREHPGTVVRRTLLNMVNSLRVSDTVYRFVPGGEVGDGWHANLDADVMGVETFHRSSARLNHGEITERYMRLATEGGIATPAWKRLVLMMRQLERGPSITRILDSRFEDYVLLCAFGGALSLWRLRRSTGVVLAGCVLLHLVAGGVFVALPRYVAPLQPVLSLYAALCIVYVVLSARWMVGAVASKLRTAKALTTP